MKEKIGSVVMTGLGAVLLMDGMKQDTTWADVPGLFTPMAVIGLAIILWRAWSGDGQFRVPAIKKLGKRP